MNKYYFISLFVLLACVSCTNDENHSQQNRVLLKKITRTYYNGGFEPEFASEEEFYYQNDVLISTVSSAQGSSDRFTVKYQYNGLKITKAAYFQNDQTVPYVNKIFSYNGEELKYIQDSNGSSKQEFFYSNGKLSRQNIYFSAVNENDPVYLGEQYNYTLSLGNILEQTYQSYAGIQIYFTTVNQYDSKNNLMKNMNPYLKFLYIDQGFNALTKNNITASSDTYLGSDTATVYDYEIIYNTDDYPIKITKKYRESQALVMVVDVEYL